jgi:hypothetical protein
MANPMTTVGDIVVGDTVSGGVAAPARLGAGASGFVLRSVGGTPAWRELSAAGLAGDRPNAIATREGQTYWSTDGAAGLELAMCVHKGGTTYAWETLAYGVTATGAALVQAADAAAARAALGLSWTEIAATEFTHTAGAVTGGVASVVSSRLHTELAGVIADDLSGGFLGPRHEIALPVDDGAAWSVAARISHTGLDANGRVSLSLRRTTVQILGATLLSSGSIETFTDGASPTSTIAAGFASGDWLRITRRGGIMEVYSGTGASLAAAVWTWRAQITVVAGQLPLTLTVSMAQYTSGPSAPPLTSDVGPIYAKGGI